MATNEERMVILRMIEEGKISAEDGTRLLVALGSPEPVPEQPPRGGARFVRIRVTDAVTGQQKVSVNLPAALVTVGLRWLPDSAGVDKSALLSAIESGMSGRLLDVQDHENGTHVEIFVE